MLSDSCATFYRIAICLGFFLATTAIPSTYCQAGEYNELLSVGDVAPAWSELPGTDDKPHSLAELASKSVVVVVFTCRSCPTARDYEQRIEDLAVKYADSDSPVSIVAISVNRVPEDTLPKLKQHAEKTQLHFGFLYDESQKIAKAYGALFTPQFFVLDNDRKIVYMGAMDDATEPDKVTKRYLEEAISAALEGKSPEVKETIARGCRIRFARERKGQ